jgi:hypothetical protein
MSGYQAIAQFQRRRYQACGFVSTTYTLFCSLRIPKGRAFNDFRTLSTKTWGVGVPLDSKMLLRPSAEYNASRTSPRRRHGETDQHLHRH